MEDVFDAAWQSDTAVRNTTIEAELESLIAIFGLALLDEPDEIRRLLTLACPQSTNEVEALIEALDAGVPQTLLGASHEWHPAADAQASTGHRVDGGPAAAAATTWAARTWGRALGLSPTGPKGPSASSLHEPTIATAATRRASGAWTSSNAFDGASRVGGAPIDRSSPGGRESPSEWSTPDSSVTAPPWKPTPGQANRASTTNGTANRREPAFGRPVDAAATAGGHPVTTRSDAPVPSASVEPASVEPAFVEPAVFKPGFVEPAYLEPAVVEPASVEPLLVEPLFSDRDLARIAHGTRAFGTASSHVDPGAAATAGGPSGPAIGDPAGPSAGADEGRPRLARRAFVIAVVSIAAVVGLLFANDAAHWLAERNAAKLVAAGASRATDRVATTGTTDATSTALEPRPEANAPQRVADVTPSNPATEGRSSTAAAATAAAPTPTPAPTPTAAQPAATDPTVLPPPSPASDREPVPGRASTVPDARRPEGDGPRPVIGRIDVPRVVEGQPFTVVLRVTDASDVVSVERRTVGSRGAWPGRGAVQKVGVQRSGSGALLVPFHAMDAPASATVEFTLVSRNGSRSEPKSATVSVAGTALASADSAASAPCTVATCGTVVESRELEYDAGNGSPIYRVVVHMDDREIVASTALYRLQLGSRVRMQNGHFVPTGTRAF